MSAQLQPRPAFGHAMRALFSLDSSGTFLNHGSYGAVPLVVQAAQQRLRESLERHPDAFFDRIKPDGEERAPRQVAARLAPLVGVRPEQLALVENATTAIQAVLDAFPLGEGDEVLITDQQYNAVRLAVLERCRETGAVPRIVEIPLPAAPADAVQRVLDAAGARTRLAVLDHVSSSSALVLPVAAIATELKRRGIAILVDGAHAIGQLPLDIPSLGADWYVSNAHKWLYAPRGSALLWASGQAPVPVQPVQVSHYVGMGFPHAFDYVGTRDYTAWLTVPAAIDFFESLDPPALWRHESRLLDAGTQAMQSAGTLPAGPREMCAAMRAFILPQRREATQQDAAATMSALWDKERIQIRCAVAGGKLLLRFSAQAYVDAADLAHLGEALQRQGWPDRR